LLINAINIKVCDAIITVRIRLHQTVLVVQIRAVLRMLLKPWLNLKLIVVFLEHHDAGEILALRRRRLHLLWDCHGWFVA
jgi:hypothetical protein